MATLIWPHSSTECTFCALKCSEYTFSWYVFNFRYKRCECECTVLTTYIDVALLEDVLVLTAWVAHCSPAAYKGFMTARPNNFWRSIFPMDYRRPKKPFFHWNPELLGLSRQIGQINSWACGVFSVKLSAPILVQSARKPVRQKFQP